MSLLKVFTCSPAENILNIPTSNMPHTEIRWNPGTQEWFCKRCGHTSDHVVEADARVELEQFDCLLPTHRPEPFGPLA